MILHIKAILDRLGLDFGGSWGRLCASWGPSWLQLGVQDRSRAALERPRAVQDSPRAAQECPRQPRTAQEPPKSFPKADQDGQELPRTRPGLVQDLPRSAPEPTHYPRLEKNSQLHPAILQNFLPCLKAANFKNERRRYSPPGGLQYYSDQRNQHTIFYNLAGTNHQNKLSGVGVEAKYFLVII